MRRPVALVMAKVPVAGQVKTRLAASVGDENAAWLAHAALLDTVDACEGAFGANRCYLALAGDLGELDRNVAERLQSRLRGWTVLGQRGTGFGERLERAHRDVHERTGAAVVQIGMDTPHVEATVLTRVGELARPSRPVLGLARDGGWWVLASTSATDVDGLRHVTMSSPQTGQATLGLLRSADLPVALAPQMRDVDDAADAEHVAASAPHTRFARTWHALPRLGEEHA